MKKLLFFVLVLFLVGFAVSARQTREQNRLRDLSQGASQNLCFLRTIETPAGNDYAYLQAVLSADQSALGVYHLLPAEKDKLVGPFKGIWRQDGSKIVLEVVHSYYAEGTSVQEERIVSVTADGASVGWGDLAETEGIYRYVDRDAVSFTETLPRVSCDDVPSEVR